MANVSNWNPKGEVLFIYYSLVVKQNKQALNKSNSGLELKSSWFQTMFCTHDHTWLFILIMTLNGTSPTKDFITRIGYSLSGIYLSLLE